MTKVVLLTLLTIILLVAIVVVVVEFQRQKQRQTAEIVQESQQQKRERIQESQQQRQRQTAEIIQESYRKQNYAFCCGDNGTGSADRSLNTYMRYDRIKNKNELYAMLLLYEHDTGNVLTLEEIKDYLAQKYEADGSLRLSSSYPQIQSYVDFMWKLHEEEKRDFRTLCELHFEECKLEKFEIALKLYGQDYLPLPYSVMIPFGSDEDNNAIYLGYEFEDLPKERVKQIVDWIFEIGWMDMVAWDEWLDENPPAIDTYAIQWKEALASGKKPVEELSDEVWNEWVLQYNEIMRNSANKELRNN